MSLLSVEISKTLKTLSHSLFISVYGDEGAMSDVVAEGDAKPTKQFSVYEATSEELIERSMAPIKKEFLCPPPSRSLKQSDVKAPHPSLVQEKKSKRQLKRERREVCPFFSKLIIRI